MKLKEIWRATLFALMVWVPVVVMSLFCFFVICLLLGG